MANKFTMIYDADFGVFIPLTQQQQEEAKQKKLSVIEMAFWLFSNISPNENNKFIINDTQLSFNDNSGQISFDAEIIAGDIPVVNIKKWKDTKGQDRHLCDFFSEYKECLSYKNGKAFFVL